MNAYARIRDMEVYYIDRNLLFAYHYWAWGGSGDLIPVHPSAPTGGCGRQGPSLTLESPRYCVSLLVAREGQAALPS